METDKPANRWWCSKCEQACSTYVSQSRYFGLTTLSKCCRALATREPKARP